MTTLLLHDIKPINGSSERYERTHLKLFSQMAAGGCNMRGAIFPSADGRLMSSRVSFIG